MQKNAIVVQGCEDKHPQTCTTTTEVQCLSHTLSHELPGSQGVKASRMSSLMFPTVRIALRTPQFLGLVMWESRILSNSIWAFRGSHQQTSSWLPGCLYSQASMSILSIPVKQSMQKLSSLKPPTFIISQFRWVRTWQCLSWVVLARGLSWGCDQTVRQRLEELLPRWRFMCC